MMALGLGRLRLAAADFWALTPRELDCALVGALGDGAPRPPIERAALDELMRQFPDRPG